MGTPERMTNYSIASLTRGLKVLSGFDATRTELSLADIAAIAEVSRPSALRIARTLQDAGYLIRNPTTKSYILGPKALSLGLTTLASLSLLEIAEPYLVSLRDRLEQTVKMAVRDDIDIIYVARLVPASRRATMDYRVGTRLPALLTSMGRAMVAPLPDKEVREILTRTKLTPFTSLTLTDPEAIWAEIQNVRRQGYATTNQGVTLERRAAAAVITNTTGEPIAAVNASVHVLEFSQDQLEEKIVPEVVATAAAISSVMPPGISGTV
jgi:IclR family pca regulon transcriptional regulator